MANSQPRQYVKLNAKKRTNRAIDINDALNIGKIRFTCVNKPNEHEKGTFTEAFMKAEDFLVIGEDIVESRFQRLYRHQINTSKGQKTVCSVSFFGTSTRTRNGKSIMEVREITFDWDETRNNPYMISLAMGEGQKDAKGNISFKGKPERSCSFFLSELECKTLFRPCILYVQAVWFGQIQQTQGYIPWINTRGDDDDSSNSTVQDDDSTTSATSAFSPADAGL